MNRIREIRKSRNLSMKELGKRVGVTEAAISNYELGKRDVGYEMYLKLAEALDSSVEELAGRSIRKGETIPGLVKEPILKWTAADVRLIEWFRSLPPEKQKAILIAQDAPEDLV